MILPQKFYECETSRVARSLLGKVLHSSIDGQLVSGRIVETEAYLPSNDSACHAAKHRTPRTEVMFGTAGMAYVYPIHAKHCFNIVTEQVEQGCAVLIRALEPITGIDQMQARRGISDIQRLTRGPGCICQAFGINRTHSGNDVTQRTAIWVVEDEVQFDSFQIFQTVRIGVTSAKHLKLRYAVKQNAYVSGPKYLR